MTHVSSTSAHTFVSTTGTSTFTTRGPWSNSTLPSASSPKYKIDENMVQPTPPAITTFDPRSDEFLARLSPRVRGPIIDTISRQFDTFVGDLKRALNNVFSEVGSGLACSVGNSLVGNNYHSKVIDFFVGGGHDMRIVDVPSDFNRLKNSFDVRFRKKIIFTSAITYLYDFLPSSELQIDLLNVWELPNNTGKVYTFQIKDSLFSNSKGPLTKSRFPTNNNAICGTDGFCISIWVIDEHVKHGILNTQPCIYECGGISWHLLRHQFKYLGLDMKPDGSITASITVGDETHRKEMPYEVYSNIHQSMNSQGSFRGQILMDKSVFERFSSMALSCREIWGVTSTYGYEGPPQFRDDNPIVKKYLLWMLGSTGVYYRRFSSSTVTNLRNSFKTIYVDSPGTVTQSFYKNWIHEITSKAEKKSSSLMWGETAVREMTPLNYEKLVYRSPIAQGLGVV